MTHNPLPVERRFTHDLSSRVTAGHQVRDVMWAVIAALVPGLLALIWQSGPGVLVQCSLAVASALIGESMALKLRSRPARPSLNDLSAMVTAILLGLSVPGLAPWWVITLGTLFAILLGKQVYGGLGCNPFNPAMVGYAILLVSFPQEMTHWPAEPVGLGETLHAIFGEMDSHRPDALAMATPLDASRTPPAMGHSTATPGGLVPASHSDSWVNLGYLLGGLWLLRRKLIDGRISAGVLAGLTACALGFYLEDSSRYPSPAFHLFSGATMLAAFFIATDPVSAATTPRGRWIYAAGIGVLIYVIRTWGGYPDGVAFAVLLMNLTAPTLDHFTRPRAYGHPR